MIAFAPFMSPEPNKDIADTVIDGMSFVREGRRLIGRIPVARFGRLSDVLIERQGDLQCVLEGERTRQGSFIAMSVQGELVLQCQRCLTPVVYPLRVSAKLKLISPGEEWPEDDLEDDDSDAIEAASEMPVLALVEEEVLLALPIVAVHGSCEPPAPAGKNLESSPFAVLAKLKK